jgi:5-formyltetrahydrofolate cyclo-ligase
VPQIVVLPLLAFDQAGHRLGYGGGFYDRTLQELRAAGPVHAVGFAYDKQAVKQVPTETTDQPMDAIVTDTGVYEML